MRPTYLFLNLKNLSSIFFTDLTTVRSARWWGIPTGSHHTVDNIYPVTWRPARSTYITMIRDPVDIFVSAWHYYKLGGSYKLTLGTLSCWQLSRVTRDTWQWTSVTKYKSFLCKDEFARSPPNVTKRKAGKMLGKSKEIFSTHYIIDKML